MIPNKLFNDRIGKYEKQVLKAFDCQDPLIRFFIMEWHRRAHKTTLAVNLLIREACKYPQSRYVYVGPTQVQAREIVWDDPNMLPDALPNKAEMFWKRNEQKMVVKFGNGSIVKFGGADKPDSLRGPDTGGVVFDEWDLIKVVTWTEIFRPIIAGRTKPGHRPRWAMFLYTPKGYHAAQMFNIAACIESELELPTEGKAEKCKARWFASRLIADESGIIEREELDEMLEEIKNGMLPQEEYDREMQCRRVTDEERTLITSVMLSKLDEVQWENYRDTAQEIRRIVAIDPAFGGDICSLKAFENGRELCQRAIKNPNMRTNDILRAAKEMAEEVDTKNFIVDCIGVGKGVADGLADDIAGYDVQYFDSAGKTTASQMRMKKDQKSIITDTYFNRKAEAVGYAASLIRRMKVENILCFETKKQLVALSRYKVARNGKTLMISNDDVKKELGCSPDKGLNWVYGQWGLQFVDPIVNESLTRYNETMKDHRERLAAKKRRRKRPQGVSVMAG